MKFCDQHWKDLKAAIEEKGLNRLVADSGQEAVENLKNEMTNGTTRSNFDPLMYAHNLITGNALNAGGLYLLSGDYCPCCEYTKHGGKENWIEYAARDAHSEAVKLGFIKRDEQ